MSTAETLAAIRKTITVEASLETAFDTFTGKLVAWWPVATHSIYRDEVAALVFDEYAGGRVYERTADGREAEWADVVVFDRPNRLVLRWRVNPDRGPTEVEVRFAVEGERTRVELEHRGWDEVGDAEGHAGYAAGWDVVLGRFADAFSAEPSRSE